MEALPIATQICGVTIGGGANPNFPLAQNVCGTKNASATSVPKVHACQKMILQYVQKNKIKAIIQEQFIQPLVGELARPGHRSVHTNMGSFPRSTPSSIWETTAFLETLDVEIQIMSHELGVTLRTLTYDGNIAMFPVVSPV